MIRVIAKVPRKRYLKQINFLDGWVYGGVWVVSPIIRNIVTYSFSKKIFRNERL